MTDSNSPDKPAPDQSNPKPFKPDPKKGWYTPSSEPPRKLNLGDDESQIDQTPLLGREAFLQSTGIELAQMESRLESALEKNFPQMGMRKIADETYVIHEEEGFRITSRKNLGKGDFSGNIAFTTFRDEKVKAQGVKTKYRLEVDPAFDYSDLSDGENIIRSIYFISQDGKCAKKERFSSGKRVVDTAENERDAQMTTNDFEVAKKSLMILLDILEPQEKKAAE